MSNFTLWAIPLKGPSVRSLGKDRPVWIHLTVYVML